jgi:hypothetical protein
VLDLGFLDHSVDSADRAANLSSDSRDGEAGCSESGDAGMPLSLGANDCQAKISSYALRWESARKAEGTGRKWRS